MYLVQFTIFILIFIIFFTLSTRVWVVASLHHIFPRKTVWSIWHCVQYLGWMLTYSNKLMEKKVDKVFRLECALQCISLANFKAVRLSRWALQSKKYQLDVAVFLKISNYYMLLKVHVWIRRPCLSRGEGARCWMELNVGPVHSVEMLAKEKQDPASFSPKPNASDSQSGSGTLREHTWAAGLPTSNMMSGSQWHPEKG